MTTKRSNTDIVMEAIQDLHAQEQIVTRETLAEVTGLKLTVIDDRVSHLIDEGLVHRVQRGVFVPAPIHKPARIITKTVLPDGTVSIEIGDDHVIQLTPREDRRLAALMVGSAQQFSAIELGHQAAHIAGDLHHQIKELRSQVRILADAKADQLPAGTVAEISRQIKQISDRVNALCRDRKAPQEQPALDLEGQ